MLGLRVQNQFVLSSFAGRIGWLPLILAGAFALTVTTVSAQTLTPLYSFTGGSDGAFPYGNLTVDASGNLYGTTYGGGSSTRCGGCGVVFKVTPTGTDSTLYSFNGFGSHDGQNPLAGLVMSSSGNLYGTTSAGGSGGTVFEVTPTGTETVLYPFNGGANDGAFPAASLIMDGSGNLYGTTEFGGTTGSGTVFKLTPTGTETVLYSFSGGGDGAYPSAGLIMDASGNLYGTTSGGGNLSGCSGNGCGVVFKVTSAGSESVLYTFTGGSDGGDSLAGLITDSAGNLYGTTSEGGNLAGCSGGCGVVFKVTPTGSESVLYTFAGGADGANPSANLIMDASGNLYGTTSAAGGAGVGTVFKVTPTGTETTLHSFTSGTDGAYPFDGLISDASGNLYGTASQGGDLAACHGFGCGVVFKLSGTGFAVPSAGFAGTPGKPDCVGVSVAVLAIKYHGIDHAAIALKYSSVKALLTAVTDYCSESKKDCGGGPHDK